LAGDVERAVLSALWDPIRRHILARLAHGSCSVSERCAPFPVSAPAMTKHLNVLERTGLIARWKQGPTSYCKLLNEPLLDAGDWIDQQRGYREQRFNGLDEFLRGRGRNMDNEVAAGTGTTLRLWHRFEAFPERVFAAWTRPEALKLWWCPAGWRPV
jgi:DNA-binding transcriptional ArsR family regulator